MYIGNHVVNVLAQNKVPKSLQKRRSEGVLPIPALYQLSAPLLLGYYYRVQGLDIHYFSEGTRSACLPGSRGRVGDSPVKDYRGSEVVRAIG